MERMKKQGKDLDLIRDIIAKLAKGQKLPKKNKDHPLQGDLTGAKGCHVQDDWVLVYKLTREILHLIRTGSHSELYKK